MGGLAPALPARRASAIPGGGLARLVACLPCLYLLFCPLSPLPPSPVGKGETQSLFRRGLRPRHPCIKPLAALTEPAKQVPEVGLCLLRGGVAAAFRYPAKVRLRRRQFGAKPIEQPFYWQCRQPRRGGTGGEELRRLRWSSPPGQGQQVPRGFSPLRAPQRQVEPMPPGAIPPAGAGRARSAGDRPSCATPLGTCTAGTVSVANGLMQGCRGRSPRRNKLIVSPFPTGEGGWGIGGRKVNQRQDRQAPKRASPLRAPQRQG